MLPRSSPCFIRGYGSSLSARRTRVECPEPKQSAEEQRKHYTRRAEPLKRCAPCTIGCTPPCEPLPRPSLDQ